MGSVDSVRVRTHEVSVAHIKQAESDHCEGGRNGNCNENEACGI